MEHQDGANGELDVKIAFNPINAAISMPAKTTEGASGYDMHADLSEPLVIAPTKSALVKTGIYMAMPKGLEFQIRARSGLAYKKQVTVLNGIGTIDSDYRGEIGIILINHGTSPFVVQPNDRIAQGVFAFVPVFNPSFVSGLPDDTERGAGAYGSTGV